MFHYIYKITNLINGKYYYGKHSTPNINDGYMGSGVALKNAKIKYGVNNFIKDILCFVDSEEELSELEEMVVTDIEVNDSNCYNLKVGGVGGWSHISTPKTWTIDSRIKSSNSHKGLKRSKESIEKGRLKMIGVSKSEEHKNKIKHSRRVNAGISKLKVTFRDGSVKLYDSIRDISKDLGIRRPTLVEIIDTNIPLRKTNRTKHDYHGITIVYI